MECIFRARDIALAELSTMKIQLTENTNAISFIEKWHALETEAVRTYLAEYVSPRTKIDNWSRQLQSQVQRLSEELAVTGAARASEVAAVRQKEQSNVSTIRSQLEDNARDLYSPGFIAAATLIGLASESRPSKVQFPHGHLHVGGAEGDGVKCEATGQKKSSSRMHESHRTTSHPRMSPCAKSDPQRKMKLGTC
jgi:hypothetical protein